MIDCVQKHKNNSEIDTTKTDQTADKQRNAPLSQRGAAILDPELRVVEVPPTFPPESPTWAGRFWKLRRSWTRGSEIKNRMHRKQMWCIPEKKAVTRPHWHRDTFVAAAPRKPTIPLHPQRVWMVLLRCAVPDSAGFWSLKKMLNMSEANGSRG